MPPRRGQGGKQRARPCAPPPGLALRRAPHERARRAPRHIEILRRRPRAQGRRLRRPARARCMRSSARTAPASRRSSRSSPACTRPTAATISIDGAAGQSRHRRARRIAGGIATVHQELLLFPELTVAENIFLGHAPRTAWGGLDWPQMRRRARQLLDSLDSHDLDVDARVGTLSVANRQRVEIAKALSPERPRPHHGRADRGARRRRRPPAHGRRPAPARPRRRHRLCQPQLPEIFELADRVTVLRDGALYRHPARSPRSTSRRWSR